MQLSSNAARNAASLSDPRTRQMVVKLDDTALPSRQPILSKGLTSLPRKEDCVWAVCWGWQFIRSPRQTFTTAK